MNDTQLRHLIHVIAEEYTLFDAMMDSLTNGVIILDSKHTIVKTNRAASRILGSSLGGGGDKPVWDSIRNLELAQEIHHIVENDEALIGKECCLHTKKGTQYIELSILPLVREKKVRGTIITLEDITQKKQEEINRRRLENLASLTNLAAAVAHEIKNPLAAISIHIQLLRKNFKACNLDINSKAQKHLDVVQEEIERLNSIVVDFLFAVRPLQCEFTRISVTKLIDTIVQTFEAEFAHAGITFSLHITEPVPDIQADERFLRQALINILVNAKAAMPAGGILSITVNVNDDKVSIVIADTGHGIPPDTLHKIFEPYFTTKPDGSGLGLTMTYKVVKEHGGDIFVYSEEGTGTRFTIVLPVSRTEKQLLLESSVEKRAGMNDEKNVGEK